MIDKVFMGKAERRGNALMLLCASVLRPLAEGGANCRQLFQLTGCRQPHRAPYFQRRMFATEQTKAMKASKLASGYEANAITYPSCLADLARQRDLAGIW